MPLIFWIASAFGTGLFMAHRAHADARIEERIQKVHTKIDNLHEKVAELHAKLPAKVA